MSSSPPLGVDISSYQGAPDWQQAKRGGVSFCIGKSTEGVSYVNPLYKPQREGAVSAGVVWGSYHFARARQNDAAAEAQHFLSASHFEAWHLVPMLDLEELGSEGVPPGPLELFAYTWGREVAAFLRVKHLLLYTDNNMLHNRIAQTARLRELFYLVLADWTLGPPNVPAGWRLAVHQFTDRGHVPGFAAPVDRDRAHIPLGGLTIHSMKLQSPPAPVFSPTTGLASRLLPHL